MLLEKKDRPEFVDKNICNIKFKYIIIFFFLKLNLLKCIFKLIKKNNNNILTRVNG